jgi:hypothetical protein
VLHLTPYCRSSPPYSSCRNSPLYILLQEFSTLHLPKGALHLTATEGILYFTSSFRILNLTPSCRSSLPKNTPAGVLPLTNSWVLHLTPFPRSSAPYTLFQNFFIFQGYEEEGPYVTLMKVGSQVPG